MQSDMRVNYTRVVHTTGVAVKTQRHIVAKNLIKGAEAKVRSQAKKADTSHAAILPSYSYRSIYPDRAVDYIAPSRRRFGTPSCLDLRTLKKLALSPVLGFDMEWRPTFIKGQPPNRVALIQLASDKDIALVHVHGLDALPEPLADILSDSSILKVGVGISGDVEKLLRDWQVEVVNTLDLSKIARKLDPHWDEVDRQRKEAQETARLAQIANAQAKALAVGIPLPSASEQQNPGNERKPKNDYSTKQEPKFCLVALARLTTRYLCLNLAKGKTARSNWENHLNEHQITYAANDAAVAYDIYRKLRDIESGTSPLPS